MSHFPTHAPYIALNHETLAEAWAWRCADTMPDSAQSRRDSEADARQLSMRLDFGALDRRSVETLSYARRGWDERAAITAPYLARAAFRACPGLRG